MFFIGSPEDRIRTCSRVPSHEKASPTQPHQSFTSVRLLFEVYAMDPGSHMADSPFWSEISTTCTQDG